MLTFTGVNIRSFDPVLAADPPAASVIETSAGGERRWADDYLEQDVSRFFYRWGGALSAVLTRLRGRYRGDLDQFALHLVLMLSELAAANAAGLARAAGATRVVRRTRGLNALSLAEITRIPRESVRRKLAAMAEQGLVVRDADGLWRLGEASDVDRFFYALSPLFWQSVKPDEAR